MTDEGQYIFFISCPQVQRGLRTLVASSDSFTTSISQQHFGFTHRYLSFLFIAMMASSYAGKLRWKETAISRHIHEEKAMCRAAIVQSAFWHSRLRYLL